MEEKLSREFHKITKGGQRIFLGSQKMTDEEVNDIVIALRDAYVYHWTGFCLTVNSSAYDINSFAGIQITPPARYKQK